MLFAQCVVCTANTWTLSLCGTTVLHTQQATPTVQYRRVQHRRCTVAVWVQVHDHVQGMQAAKDAVVRRQDHVLFHEAGAKQYFVTYFLALFSSAFLVVTRA
jgi:hypothetical protein